MKTPNFAFSGLKLLKLIPDYLISDSIFIKSYFEDKIEEKIATLWTFDSKWDLDLRSLSENIHLQYFKNSISILFWSMLI